MDSDIWLNSKIITVCHSHRGRVSIDIHIFVIYVWLEANHKTDTVEFYIFFQQFVSL